MAIRPFSFVTLFTAALLAGCSNSATDAAENNASAVIPQYNEVADINASFKSVLADRNLAAICITKGADRLSAALILRRGYDDLGPGDLEGSPAQNAPHVVGKITDIEVSTTEEGVVANTIASGKMIDAAGAPTGETVSAVRYEATLDDQAHNEFREKVILTTSNGKKEFDRCQLGESRARLRSENQEISEKFSNVLADEKLAAFCVDKSGTDYRATIRIRIEDGNVTGPSVHHEAHVKGTIAKTIANRATSATTITQTLTNGKLVQVAGEDGQPETSVSAITYRTFTPFNRDVFGDEVTLTISKNGKQEETAFKHCRLGQTLTSKVMSHDQSL